MQNFNKNHSKTAKNTTKKFVVSYFHRQELHTILNIQKHAKK